mgnify:CR=1 FL=1
MANRYIDKNAGDDVYKYIMELIPQTDDLNIFLQKIYMRYNMPVIVTDIASVSYTHLTLPTTSRV